MKTFSGYSKSLATDLSVLLAGGGTKELSKFSMDGHNHNDLYVTSVAVTDDTTNHADQLRFVKNGTSTYFTVPYATSANTANFVANKTLSITINGDSNTYYPVVLPGPGSKTGLNIISVWKNLGSTTASYANNHSNGTSSCWYMYEGRVNYWDGNGGYYRTLRAWYGYAPLCAQVEAIGGPVGSLTIWLRGGGTEYNVSCNFDFSTPQICYSKTNIGSSSPYERYVEPRTTIGNAGVIDGTFYGNCTGSAGSVAWSNISDKPDTATRWPSWSEVTDKPSTFTPASHTHSYLPLSGGNMTGNIGYVGSKATYTMISFINNTNDNYGNGIAIGGGGLTIIGGGESASVIAAQHSSGGDENMCIGNDGSIDFYSNLQDGWGYRKAMLFSTDGNLYVGDSKVWTASSLTLASAVSAVTYTPYSGDYTKQAVTNHWLAYWNGAHNTSGNSNLLYCDRGRFGTIVTKGSGDYWPLFTDSYPCLRPGSSNNWIQIGTANTSYGLIPSQSGGEGNGHNYLGTSSWYWKYAYIDEIYGHLNGSATSASYATYINRIWLRAHNCLADDIPVESRTTFYMYDSETSNKPSSGAGFMIANGWDWGKGGSLIAQNFDDGDYGRLYTNFRQCGGNWNGWKKVAFVDDISNYYWANVKVSTTSSTTTTPTFGNTTTSHHYMGGYLYMSFGGSWLSTIDNDGNGPIFGYALALNNRRVYYTGSPVYICGGSYGNYGSGITVTSGNNVGIGTTSPSYKLHVSGDIGTSGNIVISHATNATMTAASSNPKITFSESGTLPVHLTYTDYDSYRNPAGLKVVGGTDASPAWFEAEGSMYAANFYTTSDIRKKTNIINISDSIRQFNWKDSGDLSYGFIAQELEKTNPELVDKSGDHWTVNYDAAICLVIARLENRIKELEKQLGV